MAAAGKSFFLYTGYLRTFPGITELCQLILGSVCVGISGHYIFENGNTPGIFFLLMSVTFLIGTFCLLLSSLLKFGTGSLISKTVYGVVYHSVAFILYLSASVTLLIASMDYRMSNFDAHMSAAVFGLIVTCLYLVSVILAVRSYKNW